MAERRTVCPCTNCNTKTLLSIPADQRSPNCAQAVLKTLHSEHHILTSEECSLVWEAGYWWNEQLALAVTVKPPGVVQQTLDMLEEIPKKPRIANPLKLLSGLYQENLVTEDEVKSLKVGDVWHLPTQLIYIQCTKPPEVVNKTAYLLNKCDEESTKQLRVMSELYQEQLVTEDEVKQMKLNEHELIFFQCTKPTEVSTNTAAVLIKFGYDENAKKLTVLNDLFTSHHLTAEECSEVACHGKQRKEWQDPLVQVLLLKPAEVVQAASRMLEKHDCHVVELKMLSELYQKNLVTEDEVKRTVGEGGFQANQLFHIQLTKTPEVITKTADVLDKFGYDDLARRLRD